MIKRYNNLSLALGVPGILLQIVGNVISRANTETSLSLLGVPILLLGTGLLIAGLTYYATGKGRSGWWGLCGFLSCLGLLILALLKDKAPDG
jgi:hypothetical protein